jgi:hypothetical protein
MTRNRLITFIVAGALGGGTAIGLAACGEDRGGVTVEGGSTTGATTGTTGTTPAATTPTTTTAP